MADDADETMPKPAHPAAMMRRRPSMSLSLAEGVSSYLGLNLLKSETTFMDMLLSSPLGYYSSFSQEELEPLLKLFKDVSFAPGQAIATSAFYYVTSGKITIVTRNRMDGSEKRVEKRAGCLLYTSPSPRDATLSRMPSSA